MEAGKLDLETTSFDVRELVHGTTRITNAIVEGRLAPVTLLTTEGQMLWNARLGSPLGPKHRALRRLQ